MRMLILGGAGMLGHQAYRRLRGRFEVWVTFREAGAGRDHPAYRDADRARLLGGVDAAAPETVRAALDRVRPSAVVNCIGIVKQRDEAKAAVPSITVNALFPHLLAEACVARGIRLFHVSTDCVFSGAKGGYTERDNPDPVDLYGRTKLVGEVSAPGCLTLRTSMIGWEVTHRLGLLEWFAAQRGKAVRGFRNAIYSGFSTAVLADLIGDLAARSDAPAGLYHAASAPISKYDLLVQLRDALGWRDVTIEADDAFRCDRSLDAERFRAAAGWTSPTWERMIDGLAKEWPAYAEWRRES